MAASDGHAAGGAWNQRQGDATVFLVGQQAFRVVQAECQADDRRHRCQGDVAFLEIQAHAQNAGTFPIALADNAEIGNGGRIRAGGRTGQAKAGDFTAVGQARQVMVFLFLGAVMQQQFARAQGVRHADGGAQGGRHRGQLHDHAGMRECGKAQTAVFLGDDHAEEFIDFQVLPDFRCQVGVHMGGFPVIDHAAHGFHRAVDESLLFSGQHRFWLAEQHLPVRFA